VCADRAIGHGEDDDGADCLVVMSVCKARGDLTKSA